MIKCKDKKIGDEIKKREDTHKIGKSGLNLR